MQVAVIGGGVVGLTAAVWLLKQGHAVTLFDRGETASVASYGNAGALAFSEIIPLARPGVIRKSFSWLADPLGPLHIPAPYALHIAPWLLRFWRASRRDRFDACVQAQAALMDLSRCATEKQVAQFHQSHLLSVWPKTS